MLKLRFFFRKRDVKKKKKKGKKPTKKGKRTEYKSDTVKEEIHKPTGKRYVLLIPDRMLKRIKEDLLSDPENREKHGFLFTSDYTVGNTTYLSAVLYASTADEELETKEKIEVVVKKEKIIETLETCRINRFSLIDCHSHPFSEYPEFSQIDNYFGTENAEWLQKKIERGDFPAIYWGMLVFGKISFKGRIWDREKGKFKDFHKIITPFEVFVKGIEDSAERKTDSDMYDRQIRFLSEGIQQRLGTLKVCIVGLGGLGAVVAEELGRIGVRDFVLIDGDRVERSNLPRLIGIYEDQLGKYKTEAVTEELLRIDNEMSVKTYNFYITRKNFEELLQAISDRDVIIGCIDNDAARRILNEAAVRFLKVFFDLGTGIRITEDKTEIGGQIRFINPGTNFCLICYGKKGLDFREVVLTEMDEEDIEIRRSLGYVEGTDITPVPSVLSLNAIIASIFVQNMINIIAGFSDPKPFIHYDAINVKLADPFDGKSPAPNPRCPACGHGGYLGLARKERKTIITGETEKIKLQIRDNMYRILRKMGKTL